MSKMVIALMIGLTLVGAPVGVKQYTTAQEKAVWERQKVITEKELVKHEVYYEGRKPRLFLQELDAIANYFVITKFESATEEPTRARVMKLRWELHNSDSLVEFTVDERILLDNILWSWEESNWNIIDSQHDGISILQQKWSRYENYGRNAQYDGLHGYATGFKNITQPHWEPMHNANVPRYQEPQ